MKQVAALLLCALLPAAAPGDELKRRAFFGAGLAPGAAVSAVAPGSPAAEAGLRAGDRIVSLGGVPMRAPADVLSWLRTAPTDRAAPVVMERGEAVWSASLRLRELPREASADYEVVYGSVSAGGERQRTVVTKPAGAGPFPAVLLVGGVGCYSIDNPLQPPLPYQRMLGAMTRAGFATMRVEKRGMGDSEGGPCMETDFERETAGYRAGLAALAASPFVNRARLFLFGHSMGGISGPLVARGTPVRGVIAMATVGTSWFEYLLANSRRQAALRGAPDEEVDRRVRVEERCAHALLVERRPRGEILAAMPECAGHFEYPASDRYMQQVAALDLGAVWKDCEAAVAVVYGKSDYVTSAREHEYNGGAHRPQAQGPGDAHRGRRAGPFLPARAIAGGQREAERCARTGDPVRRRRGGGDPDRLDEAGVAYWSPGGFMEILTIGGTGTVGSQVARGLAEGGHVVRVMSRKPERVAGGVAGDLRRPESLARAFEGVEGVFLATALAEDETAQGLAAVRAARDAGVRKMVYMSVHKVEAAPHIPHFATKLPIERAIRDAGIAYTFLRPNNFFQNDLWVRDAMALHGVYPQPIGGAGISRVDTRDIADAAVAALTRPGHDGAAYALVGPDALTGESVAEIWGRQLGRPVRYAGDDLDAWAAQARGMMPEWLVADLCIMYRHFQEHGLRATEEELAALAGVLGRPPRRFEDFAAETATGWRSQAS